MTSKRIAHDRQQKSDKSQESGILQRAAVRLVADAGMQSTDDKEALTLSNSAFSKDFSRVPISTTKPQQFQPRNSQSHLMPPIQAKLTIGEPGDRYEQEADRVASEVVQRINAPALAGRSVQRQEEAEKDIQAKPEITTLQRMKEPKEELQAKLAIAGGEASTDLESTINRARGSGQPLEAGLQRSMGQAMGAEFSGVRVHTDTQADHLNQSIQAKAFTTGQDVFFRQGKYNHSSRGGQELIAHELTHVVQQTGAKEVISREGNVSIRSDNNYQYGKIIQCELDGSSSNAQAYSYGLIHGQYWPETNRADGHVNPGNANAGLELNHLKQVVNDLLQAMTTRESAGGPTGSIE
ncbi:eCIS core domain-containing protein [Nostoc sp.]